MRELGSWDGVDVGAIYTWGFDRAFDKGWTAIGPHKAGKEISFGLISPMGNVYATCFASATQHLDSARIPGQLGKDAGSRVVH